MTITRWWKSSRTIDQPTKNNCVEVGDGGTVIAVRDTKNHKGHTLTVSREHFAAFVNDIKDNQLTI